MYGNTIRKSSDAVLFLGFKGSRSAFYGFQAFMIITSAGRARDSARSPDPRFSARLPPRRFPDFRVSGFGVPENSSKRNVFLV